MVVEAEEEEGAGDGDGIEDKSSGASPEASVEGWSLEAEAPPGAVRLRVVSVVVVAVLVAEGQVLQVCGQSAWTRLLE